MTNLLDQNVLPENYSLKINIEEHFFTGIEEITLNIMKNTKQFNFNISNIEILDLFFKYEGQCIKPSVEIKEEVATVFFTEELKSNTQGSLCINYIATYVKAKIGFIKSKYYENLIFFTNFEQKGARRAFPCWDQPDIKATFDISIYPLTRYNALSNSSLKEIKDGFYVFNTTPKMSTYNVAFISGKLSHQKAKTKRNVPIKIYTHKDEKMSRIYALDVAVECFNFFEEYFGIYYPLPKLDLICVPKLDLISMENWGLITFQRTSLLFNDDFCSYEGKKTVAESVCHEISHMWFGNLVTLTSWDDDWLKEGFATWAAYLAMNNISKQLISWNVDINFIRNNIEAGIRTDYHDPIQLVFHDTNAFNEMGLIVDETSVPKAASLIWMLENYIGKEEFKNGIRLFLKRYEYSNANQVNLWNSFNTNFKVEKFMNSWIEKQGCPLVTISEEKKNKEESEYLIIKQKRFLSSDKENNTIWEIPITFSWGETVLMTQREIRI